jgi:class 3 adenylate cyclase
MTDPDIRYVRNGGVAIAYQIVGSGDTDVIYVPDWMSNLVYGWESGPWRPFYERLARSFRLILFDKRGTGLSDYGGQFATLETRMEDMRAVLDAAGSAKPLVLAAQEGCGMAALFAATYPERTRALALFHGVSHAGMFEEEELSDETLSDLRDRWGTQEYSDELLAYGAPSMAADPESRRWFTNWLRVGATPSVAYAINRAFSETDLRDVLPAVRVPTLVLYRAPFERDAVDMAGRIPDASLLRLSGDEYFDLHSSPEVPDELERFVAGEAPVPVPDSVLTTVMFTDIVGSTERAAELGDRAWRDLLAQHHTRVRRELARFRGVERDTAGDGFFATFDGPVRAIRCGQAIGATVRELGLDVRIGVHVGECEVHEDKLAGIAVSAGARVAALAQPGEVLISRTVRDLVAGSGLDFDDRGEHELKGLPGRWQLYGARADA